MSQIEQLRIRYARRSLEIALWKSRHEKRGDELIKAIMKAGK